MLELLEGESLADRLARGPLPIEQVLRYGVQIAEALDKAHRNGIVHRDLKPGNVMLTKTGAKLLDFGLARTGATPGEQLASRYPSRIDSEPVRTTEYFERKSVIATFGGIGASRPLLIRSRQRNRMMDGFDPGRTSRK